MRGVVKIVMRKEVTAWSANFLYNKKLLSYYAECKVDRKVILILCSL